MWNMKISERRTFGEDKKNGKHKDQKCICSWHVWNSKKTSVFETEWTEGKVIRNVIRETGRYAWCSGPRPDFGTHLCGWKWLKDCDQRSNTIKLMFRKHHSICYQRNRSWRSTEARIESGLWLGVYSNNLDRKMRVFKTMEVGRMEHGNDTTCWWLEY